MSEKNYTLNVKKLAPNAILPSRAHPTDAGLDLVYSRDEDFIINAGGYRVVPLDISVQLNAEVIHRNGSNAHHIEIKDRNWYLRIAPRSGLAAKYGIHVNAGVVDESYTGPLQVVLFNSSTNDFIIKKGDKIAQLLVERICYPTVQEVDILNETDRGAGGFGSTDAKN